MSTKKTVRKKAVNNAAIQPIIENEEYKESQSSHNASFQQEQISEMLEDIHDMIENMGHLSMDIMKTITDSMTLTVNLLASTSSGASECVSEVLSRNADMSKDFMKCGNAADLLSFQHNIFNNNYGMINKFGINCGDHVNGFSKGLSEIVSYNMQNHWLEKFKRKKKFN